MPIKRSAANETFARSPNWANDGAANVVASAMTAVVMIFCMTTSKALSILHEKPERGEEFSDPLTMSCCDTPQRVEGYFECRYVFRRLPQETLNVGLRTECSIDVNVVAFAIRAERDEV